MNWLIRLAEKYSVCAELIFIQPKKFFGLAGLEGLIPDKENRFSRTNS